MSGEPTTLPALPGDSQMPALPAERRILDQRAQILARPRVVATDRVEPGIRFLRCRLGASELYGVPYAFLEEVIYPDVAERIPGTPAFIVGVAARRGELLTIIDPTHFFRVEPAPRGPEARIVVVHHHGDRVGLLFHAVDGDDLYHPSQLIPPFVSAGIANLNHVEGIYNSSVTMLRIDSILDDPMLVVDQRNERRRNE